MHHLSLDLQTGSNGQQRQSPYGMLPKLSIFNQLPENQSEKLADYVEMGGLSSDSESIDDDALRSVDAFSSDSNDDSDDDLVLPPNLID